MLDVIVAVEVIGDVIGVLTSENIAYEVRYDLACGFFIGAVFIERAVDLSVA